MKDKLKERKRQVEERFETLKSQRAKLTEQRSELDRKLAEVAQEQVRLQGEFRALESLESGGNESKGKK